MPKQLTPEQRARKAAWTREYERRRYRDDPAYRQRKLAISKKYAEAHPDSNKRSVEKYKEAHPQARKEIQARYYLRNKEKINERRRAYYQKNKDKKLAYSQRWQNANKDKVNEKARRYRQKHPDRLRKAKSKWNAANQEHVKNTLRKWRAENRDRVKAKAAAWKAANTAAWHAMRLDAHHKRRALKKGCEGSHTREEWADILNRYDLCCAYCGEQQTEERRLTRDHYISLTKGGSNYASNIVPACVSCNSKKKNRDPIEFMRSEGFLI